MQDLIENVLLTFEFFFLNSEFSGEGQFKPYVYQGNTYKIHETDYECVLKIIKCIEHSYLQCSKKPNKS